MVYSDVISVESALSYFDDAIAYCESTCLTDAQLDKLIDPEREKCISVESALNCLDDAIAYCESTCLTDEQVDKLIDPEGENIPLNCLQPLLRRACQWVRKKMTVLVIPWWYNGVESRLLKRHGNTLIHIDAHSDFAPPGHFANIASFKHVYRSRPSSFLPLMQSNDVFIISAIIQGLINKVVWIQPNWGKDSKSTFFSKSFVGYNVSGGVSTVCVCHHERFNGSWSPADCSIVKSDRKPLNESVIQIKPHHCKVIRHFKFIMLGEDDVTTALKVKNIKSAIIDIDEDYFGVQSGVGYFVSKGVTEDVQRELDVFFNAMFCLYSLRDERTLNGKMKKLFNKLASLKAQRNLNDAYKFLEVVNRFVGPYVCEFTGMDDVIIELFKSIRKLTVRELASLTKINYCLMSRYSCRIFSNTTNCFGICHGTIFPKDTLNQIYVNNLDDITARSRRLEGVLHHIMKSGHLGLMTIARSLRDGYTPRSQQQFIEKNLLISVHKSLALVGKSPNVIYSKQLFGEKGWEV